MQLRWVFEFMLKHQSCACCCLNYSSSGETLNPNKLGVVLGGPSTTNEVHMFCLGAASYTGTVKGHRTKDSTRGPQSKAARLEIIPGACLRVSSRRSVVWGTSLWRRAPHPGGKVRQRMGRSRIGCARRVLAVLLWS